LRDAVGMSQRCQQPTFAARLTAGQLDNSILE
jgi:hypothetical protein